MATNVALCEVKTQEKPFPKLMKCKKSKPLFVVYFSDESRNDNTVVVASGNYEMFEKFKGNINSGEWEDYNEPITIKNA